MIPLLDHRDTVIVVGTSVRKPLPIKPCRTCKQEKPLSEFYLDRGKHVNQCKSCTLIYVREHERKNKPRILARDKAHRKANKWLYRFRFWRWKTGATKEQFDALFTDGARCAICGATDEQATLHIDHDHATLHLRGLLCVHCNIGVGHFKESPALLEKAIAYLHRTKA